MLNEKTEKTPYMIDLKMEHIKWAEDPRTLFSWSCRFNYFEIIRSGNVATEFTQSKTKYANLRLELHSKSVDVFTFTAECSGHSHQSKIRDIFCSILYELDSHKKILKKSHTASMVECTFLKTHLNDLLLALSKRNLIPDCSQILSEIQRETKSSSNSGPLNATAPSPKHREKPRLPAFVAVEKKNIAPAVIPEIKKETLSEQRNDGFQLVQNRASFFIDKKHSPRRHKKSSTKKPKKSFYKEGLALELAKSQAKALAERYQLKTPNAGEVIEARDSFSAFP